MGQEEDVRDFTVEIRRKLKKEVFWPFAEVLVSQPVTQKTGCAKNIKSLKIESRSSDCRSQVCLQQVVDIIMA